MKPILFLLIFVIFLSACGSAATTQPSVSLPAETAPATSQPVIDAATRTDEQGAVVVEVTPLTVDQPGQTLDFQVLMNTHLVDLSMDLATLSVLMTDTGVQVEAVSWDGPPGGHHVSGTLSFPASVAGKDLLEGASQLTLTIRSVDAQTRVFTWSITQ
jgi:hypothetical protein